MPFQVTYYDPKTGKENVEGVLPDGPYKLALWNRAVSVEIQGESLTIFCRETNKGIGETIFFGFEPRDIVDSVTLTPREGPVVWVQSGYESRRLSRVGVEGEPR